MIALIPSPSKKKPQPADTTSPAVSSTNIRRYADRDTQTALDLWKLGAAYVARMVAESTLETEAPRERIRQLAGLE